MPQTGRELVPAIVLAAGQSARFGENKLLKQLGGQALIDYPLAALAGAGSAPVYLVLGYDADALRAHCDAAGHAVQYVINKNYAVGRASSVQAGLAAISDDASGALITPADVPLISQALIAALLAEFQRTRQLTFPMTSNGRGHPVIFPRDAFPLLQGLRGEATLHDYMLSQPDANAVPWEDGGCTLDLDTPEDFARLERELTRRGLG